MYPGMSPVSRQVWIRDFNTCGGSESNFLCLKDLDISRPLPFVKQVHLCLRRPQQLRGMCRDIGFFWRFHWVDFGTLRGMLGRFHCVAFAALCRDVGFAALRTVLGLFRRKAFAELCRVLGFSALRRVLGRFRCVPFAARFEARCFLTASRTRRRSSSAGERA